MSLCEQHYSQGQLDVGPVQCLYVNLTVRVHYTSPISKVVQHLTEHDCKVVHIDIATGQHIKTLHI